jgi:hypothetical protein
MYIGDLACLLLPIFISEKGMTKEEPFMHRLKLGRFFRQGISLYIAL